MKLLGVDRWEGKVCNGFAAMGFKSLKSKWVCEWRLMEESSWTDGSVSDCCWEKVGLGGLEQRRWKAKCHGISWCKAGYRISVSGSCCEVNEVGLTDVDVLAKNGIRLWRFIGRWLGVGIYERGRSGMWGTNGG